MMTRSLQTACLMVLFAAPLFAEVDATVTPDVVYGHKDGMALTFDVVTPAEQNTAAVLWLQSGGWYSHWIDPQTHSRRSECQALVKEGYTVFLVRHGSAPRFHVPDAVEDVRRCVRYLRLHSDEFGIDPARIGSLGSSAGGHLTVVLSTTGDDGDPDSSDEVLRQSSRIACGVALAPPTDLRGWTTHPPEAIAAIPNLLPPLEFAASLEEAVSPVVHVTPDDAPLLMIHGDRDQLVPITHCRSILPALERAGVPAELIVIEGAAHGFSPDQYDSQVFPGALRWFKQYLLNTE